MIKPEHLQQIAKDCADLTARKNAAYGNSFAESGEILKILMRNQPCPPEKFQILLTVARIIDKLFRICTDETAFQEDPWKDILGYALLMCASKPGLIESMGLGTGVAFDMEKAKKDLCTDLYEKIRREPLITATDVMQNSWPGRCSVCNEPLAETHKIHTPEEWEKRILSGKPIFNLNKQGGSNAPVPDNRVHNNRCDLDRVALDRPDLRRVGVKKVRRSRVRKSSKRAARPAVSCKSKARSRRDQ